jgi:predicted MFS family arabinose efflux permease
VNAATFAVSALLLWGMRVPPHPSLSARRGGLPQEPYFDALANGFRWLRHQVAFLELTLSATFFNFCYTLVGTFLVIFATRVLHGSALIYALLLASEVAGTAVGTLLVGRVRAVRWAGLAWTLPYGAVSGLVAVLLALAPSIPVALVALFALGALGGFAGTAWLSAAQLLVPTDMQGRYFGIDNLGSNVVVPAAQIGGAFLITAFGVQETYLLAGVVWVAAGLVFLLPRELRRLGVRSGAESVSRQTGVGAAGTPGSPGESRGA